MELESVQCIDISKDTNLFQIVSCDLKNIKIIDKKESISFRY